MDLAEGLGKTGGTFEVQASAENTKMTVNDPRLQDVMLGRAQHRQEHLLAHVGEALRIRVRTSTIPSSRASTRRAGSPHDST